MHMPPDRSEPHSAHVQSEQFAVPTDDSSPMLPDDELGSSTLAPELPALGVRRRSRSLVTPDGQIKPHLAADEPLLARRTEATLTHVADGQGHQRNVARGALYLTDRRLVHFGASALSSAETTVDLLDVTELALSGERLLITLAGQRGFMLDLESPVDFRAQMALAISTRRHSAVAR